MSTQHDSSDDCGPVLDTDIGDVAALLSDRCNEHAWLESSLVVDLSEFR